MFYHNSAGLLGERPVPLPAKLDVNYSDDKGPLLFQTLWPDVTPSLDASTISQQCDMANVLLKAGSDPNIKWSGVTPLLKASDCAQMDFVDVLLEAGADVTCKDKNNDIQRWFHDSFDLGRVVRLGKGYHSFPQTWRQD
ncbi:hypothetical protein F5882DRAFT_395939 [Hyaloscypha sp. PMI_1271]|nr:hypothetical protein F5882DRAFT_395939 [Hyaloscypha sp. PMI_1271]